MKKYTGDIITHDAAVPGEVTEENGNITYVGLRDRSTDALCDEICDYQGAFIAPGFIDIHVHGGGGSDFLDGTRHDFLTVAAMHASHGTAVMLPTTLCCPDGELFKFFDIYRSVVDTEYDGAAFAGVHLEGPYIAASQKGAQDETYLKNPTKEHYSKILEYGKGIIRRWTIAPELDGAMQLGKMLAAGGICASIGHSDASCDIAREALKNGYNMLTHFYSGMSTISRKGGFRIAGLVEAGYLYDDMCVEIICDGCHLPTELLQTVYKYKGSERTALITDAMRGAGSLSGETVLGSRTNGQRCIIEDGVAKLPDRTAFAGSVCTADRLLKTAVELMIKPYCASCGVDDSRAIVEGVKMLTSTPARLVKLKTKGHLAKGYDADFTIFDRNYNILATVAGGRTVYKGV